MNSYVQQLKLNFDPFDVATSKNGEFFEGGNRRVLLDRVVERAMYSESVIAITGCLGAGKTSLGKAISKKFSDEAVIVNVVATLFMNSDQFLNELATALALPADSESGENRASAVVALAGRLQANGSSLLIQVDDAHEMSAEVLKELVELKTESPAESLQIILFGESQLGSMLENTLEPDELAILAEFELEGFGSEATIDYVRFKLACAGYSKPLPLSGNELGAIHNASQGMPGAINGLVRNELEKQAAPEPAVVSGELEELEQQFSSSSALHESDYTEAELEEFSAAVDMEVENEPERQESAVANRYFIAAGIMLVVLVGAVTLFRSTDNTQSATAQIEVAATSASSNPTETLSAIAQRPRLTDAGVYSVRPDQAVEAANQEINLPNEEAREEVVSDVLSTISTIDSQLREEEEAVMSRAEDVNNVVGSELAREGMSEGMSEELARENETPIEESSVSSTSSSVESSVSAGKQDAAPESIVAESSLVAAASTAQEFTSFEQWLLAEPATNFTVQLVAALSEANIAAFIAANPEVNGSGYFETRLNGKPWFVVVAGSFSNRNSAADWLKDLPASIKSSGPWVRDLAGIQSDLRAR
ncbi:MAG: AAA family ATPase [Pseudohongiellaceae bacterium]